VSADELIVLEPDALEELAELEPLVRRLDRDLVAAASAMDRNEMRYLVSTYYGVQRVRVQIQLRARSLQKTGRPARHLVWLARNLKGLEHQLTRVMQAWLAEYEVGQWCLDQFGVGPTTAAPLVAYIDIEKAPTVGHVWRFCGLDPTVTWRKGEKRPWNALLKTVCYQIADSFVKHSNNEKCFYGHVYRKRKQLEWERNQAGAYAEQAFEKLRTKRVTDPGSRAWLERGMLTPGHIDMRARRYAVKLFLSHFHWVLYETTYRRPAPRPYVIEHLGHADLIVPPHYTPLPRAA